MDHILALKRLTPAKSSSEYAFGGQVSLKEDVVVSVASAWRHLRAFAVSLSRDAIDETLILLQNVPEIAIAWLDLGCAELQKDVFAPVWNEVIGEALGVFLAMARMPESRDVLACDRPLISAVETAFLLSGNPDVIAECLRLFASLLLSCGGDGEDDIAAAHVIASPDIVQKAVFVARNAVDAPIVQSALGFLINLSIAVPNLFTKNLAECRAAKVAADEQSASAAALAAALGVAPGNNTAAVTSNDPESLFAISFGCAAAIPVTEGDSPRIQLLGRWLDTLLRLLDPALAVTLLLSKCDTLNSVLLQSNAPASTDSSAKRLIDSICQILTCASTPESAAIVLLGIAPYAADTKVCAALMNNSSVVGACILVVEPFAWLCSYGQLCVRAAGVGAQLLEEQEEDVMEAGAVFQLLCRLYRCGGDVLSRWKPSGGPQPTAIANVLKSTDVCVKRLDTILRSARLWVMTARACASDSAPLLRSTANAAVDAVQALSTLVTSAHALTPESELLQRCSRQLSFVTKAGAGGDVPPEGLSTAVATPAPSTAPGTTGPFFPRQTDMLAGGRSKPSASPPKPRMAVSKGHNDELWFTKPKAGQGTSVVSGTSGAAPQPWFTKPPAVGANSKAASVVSANGTSSAAPPTSFDNGILLKSWSKARLGDEDFELPVPPQSHQGEEDEDDEEEEEVEGEWSDIVEGSTAHTPVEPPPAQHADDTEYFIDDSTGLYYFFDKDRDEYVQLPEDLAAVIAESSSVSLEGEPQYFIDESNGRYGYLDESGAFVYVDGETAPGLPAPSSPQLPVPPPPAPPAPSAQDSVSVSTPSVSLGSTDGSSSIPNIDGILRRAKAIVSKYHKPTVLDEVKQLKLQLRRTTKLAVTAAVAAKQAAQQYASPQVTLKSWLAGKNMPEPNLDLIIRSYKKIMRQATMDSFGSAISVRKVFAPRPSPMFQSSTPRLMGPVRRPPQANGMTMVQIVMPPQKKGRKPNIRARNGKRRSRKVRVKRRFIHRMSPSRSSARRNTAASVTTESVLEELVDVLPVGRRSKSTSRRSVRSDVSSLDSDTTDGEDEKYRMNKLKARVKRTATRASGLQPLPAVLEDVGHMFDRHGLTNGKQPVTETSDSGSDEDSDVSDDNPEAAEDTDDDTDGGSDDEDLRSVGSGVGSAAVPTPRRGEGYHSTSTSERTLSGTESQLLESITARISNLTKLLSKDSA